MSLRVILKHHKGERFVPELNKTVEEPLPQDMILVTSPEREQQGKSPFLFGYVGHHPHAPINPVVELPAVINEEIVRQVNQARDGTAPHLLAAIYGAHAAPRKSETQDESDE